MLDIVAAHQDKLALPVERERVDQAEARLARPAAAGEAQAMAEQRAIGDDDRDEQDQRHDRQHRDLQHRFVAQRKIS
ncbi:MAG: hypothetical protein ACLQJL_19890 [Roseiarcus sp.]